MTMDRIVPEAAPTRGTIRSSAATHPGTRRARNEDALLDRPDLGLWAVADGAGGHSHGEAAARAVVAALDAIPAGLTAAETLTQVRLRLAAAHDTLRDQAGRLGEGAMMASTVVVLIARDDYFACLWAGDSRAYLARGGTVDQLTVDHSRVQDLLDRGSIGAAEAEGHPEANVITRAIGAAGVEPGLDKRMGQIVSGDRFLLCSDGVCKSVGSHELSERLCDGSEAGEIVAATLARSATDNVTAVVIDFLDAKGMSSPAPVA
jgi:protein phosphatase/serine/threonine-protein phosphatase Stp1